MASKFGRKVGWAPFRDQLRLRTTMAAMNWPATPPRCYRRPDIRPRSRIVAHRPGCVSGVVSAAQAARFARHAVSSQADAVELVAECSIPVT